MKVCKTCSKSFDKHRQSASECVPCYWRRVNDKRKAYLDAYQSRYNETRDKAAKLAQNKAYQQANKEKCRAAGLRWMERVGKAMKRSRYKHLYATDVRFRLDEIIRYNIRRFEKGKHPRTFGMLGYTQLELRTHLERYFNSTNGFTWENQGSVWQLDHVVPRSWFDYKDITDPQFKACWGLHNLRPALLELNRFKGNKFVADISCCKTREEVSQLVLSTSKT